MPFFERASTLPAEDCRVLGLISGPSPSIAEGALLSLISTVEPTASAPDNACPFARSPNCAIVKAERLLGYAPRFTSLEAVVDAPAVMDLADALA